MINLIACQVYNVDTDTMEEMKFLPMGFIDNYNKTMVDVDQLRGSYRFDMWAPALTPTHPGTQFYCTYLYFQCNEIR